MRNAAWVATVLLGLTASLRAATFTVTSNADTGPGTLRSAIENANATAGADSITTAGPIGVALASPLPSITDRLAIAGLIEVDGTNAGSTDGLVVASNDFQAHCCLSLRNFSGDGLVLAGEGASIDSISVSGSANGVRITGKRNAVVTGTITGNRSNGILVEATGSATLGNVVVCGIGEQPGTITISNNGGHGIDLEGDGSALLSVFILSNAGDGLHIAGDHTTLSGSSCSGLGNNGGDGIRVDGSHTTISGMSVEGSGANGVILNGANNTLSGIEVSGSAADGVVINGAGHSLSAMTSSNNRGTAYRFLQDATVDRLSGVCDNPLIVTNSGILPPVITSSTRSLTTLTANGTLRSYPNTRFRIEVLAAGDATCAQPGGRAVGSSEVTTDASGFATFSATAPLDPTRAKYVAAYATRLLSDGTPSGGTSPLSATIGSTAEPDGHADLSIEAHAPSAAPPGQKITVDYVITNHGPAAAASFRLWLFQPARPAGPASVSGDGWSCSDGGCFFTKTVAAGASMTARASYTVAGAPGSTFDTAANLDFTADPQTANNTARAGISVVDLSPVPALSDLALIALMLMLGTIASFRLRF